MFSGRYRLLPVVLTSLLHNIHLSTSFSVTTWGLKSPPLHEKTNGVFNNKVLTYNIESSSLHLFGDLGKVFEESGPLGKGITVGKVQVALQASDRSSSSIFGLLEKKAKSSGDSPAELARLCSDVSLALLRKSDDWTAACSSSEWFSGNDAGKAERTFNDLANKEAAKFEKEYIPSASSDEKGGGSTLVVVSLVIEIQGDSTNFDGAGFSFSGTQEVLSSIASDCTVDEGYCLNAVEVFWCPGERDEVLTSRDIVLDFPELIDL